MIFNSIDFGIFFPLVFFFFWIVFKDSIKERNIFLIAVSYFFYGWWDWRFLSLIVISSVIDFITGNKIFEEADEKKRKIWLFFSLVTNLGFLGFFKYYNFFIDSFIDSFSLFGVDIGSSNLDIILPAGISFYTFQTLSYTLDIYYKKIKPTKDVFSFFAFVSFFPQLVAGPIERAKDLLPQFFTKSKINYKLLRSGLLLMVWGFFKKIVIADRLAIFVDATYKDIEHLDTVTFCVTVLFFAFQLYLDFSAYSNIAIGSARLLGFNLSTNFKQPYLAKSFSNFWQRWHISLSSWFKDYVYIPLGGNKVTKSKVTRNILIVFVLSGLWHGASWNFVIWGLLNAIFILLFDRFLSNKNNNVFKRIFTSLFVTVSWSLSLVFFRAKTFGDAMNMFSSVLNESQDLLYTYGLNAIEFEYTVYLLMGYMALEIAIDKYDNLYSWFVSRVFVVRWTIYLSAILVILLFGSYGVGLNDNNFIYFQF
jgi:D-alanyl-lipoteichoic acid acyltransferase DltB (MBOAT superfamily)